jgi:hypothetical protein
MALKNFIKENLVLIIGLTLPVLLIALFFLATVLPKSLAPPPHYALLFSYIRYDYQNPAPVNVEFIVKDTVLKARVTKVDKKIQNYNLKRLMVYEPKSESVSEIPYTLPVLADNAETLELMLPETQNMTLDSNSTAPDGFSFEGPNYGHGGLVTELFGGGYRNQGYRIKKGSVAYKIPSVQNDYYFNGLQFIGWIVARK